jgi:aerobic carbon-monoxide dehydrogenase medium subunit
MYDFNFQKASSVQDAVSKHKAASDARFLAGGMTLIPVLKQRLDQPSDVIDLGAVKDLVGISEEGGAIVIKAMTKHHDVNTSDLVKKRIPALAELAGTIGDPMVRNRGTIGGSLANSDPAASYPSAVLALNATIHTDKRAIKADDFFKGMFTTALEAGELITKVSFPIPDKAGYRHFPNPASRFPIVGVFVAQFKDGTRVGVTGAGPCAYRVPDFEKALAGGWDPEKLKPIKVSDQGLNTDIHASAEYRAHLVNVMARRAIGG